MQSPCCLSRAPVVCLTPVSESRGFRTQQKKTETRDESVGDWCGGAGRLLCDSFAEPAVADSKTTADAGDWNTCLQLPRAAWQAWFAAGSACRQVSPAAEKWRCVHFAAYAVVLQINATPRVPLFACRRSCACDSCRAARRPVCSNFAIELCLIHRLGIAISVHAIRCRVQCRVRQLVHTLY